MENLEFILGILTTVGIFLVGYAAVGVFKVKNEVRNHEDQINQLFRDIKQTERDLIDNLNNEILDKQSQIDEIYRHIDSRFDKFENKINKK